MTREIRIEDMVRIHDPKPGAPSRVLGVWPGNPTSATRVLTNNMLAATEKILRGAHDVRGNRNYGPVEAGERLREISGPSLRALNEHATTLRANKEKLRDTLCAISPVKPYDQAGHWQAMIDTRLVDAFNALSVSEKATMKHQLLSEPLMNWALADAMLRLPLLVTGLEHSERHTIKINLFKSLHAEEFSALSEQMEQVMFAESALRMAVDTAIETTGSRSDISEHAPTALELAQASDALGWQT
jgi:hypothetical protein